MDPYISSSSSSMHSVPAIETSTTFHLEIQISSFHLDYRSFALLADFVPIDLVGSALSVDGLEMAAVCFLLDCFLGYFRGSDWIILSDCHFGCFLVLGSESKSFCYGRVVLTHYYCRLWRD